MKSIKPGRGPSMLIGIISAAFAVFGIIWMIYVASIGGGIMSLFGLLIVFVMGANAVYHIKNARSKNRYSQYDITDRNEEPDPWNEQFGEKYKPDNAQPTVKGRYCPYCGTKNEEDYKFCTDCGRELP